MPNESVTNNMELNNDEIKKAVERYNNSDIAVRLFLDVKNCSVWSTLYETLNELDIQNEKEVFTVLAKEEGVKESCKSVEDVNQLCQKILDRHR